MERTLIPADNLTMGGEEYPMLGLSTKGQAWNTPVSFITTVGVDQRRPIE